MRVDARVAVLLGTLAGVGGCGRAGRTPAAQPAAAAEVPPAERCPASVPNVDVSAWRAVAGDGFTFCVPPEWRGSGRAWGRGAATVTWGTGEPLRTQVWSEVGRVPASEAGAAPEAPPDSDIRRFAEAIGGRDAQVWRNRFGATFYTGARWNSPRIWLTGKAAAADAADLQLTIFRTVRFPAR